MKLDEYLFIKSLTERPEDAKRFSQTFEPTWLQTVPLRPILNEVYDFTKQYSTPPSLDVLKRIFKDKDESIYNARIKPELEKLESINTDDVSSVLYNINQAKDTAIAWSLNEMMSGAEVQSLLEDQDGSALLGVFQKWIQSFEGSSDDVELSVREAIEDLVSHHEWSTESTRIPCGISIIDEWTGGGLRPKQTGIILSPTAGGKSTALMIMAYKIASVALKRVLFISNELAMDEVAERFMSLLSGQHLTAIMSNPAIGYNGLERHWNMGLDNRLRLVQVAREISTNDIEAMIAKYIHLYGWAPQAIIIDYMERMKPTISGLRRDQTWNWYGAIAQDIVRMNKKRNILTWTAGQVNRSGYNVNNEQNIDQTQGSIKHLQEADAVIHMRQQPTFRLQDPARVMLQFRALRMRQSRRADNSVFVEADMGKMLITDQVHTIEELTRRSNQDSVNGIPLDFDETEDNNNEE